MYAASALKAMLGRATTGTVPTELIPIDRIMQRWAVSVGLGLPSEVWDDSPAARPPPLDDDTATVVDQIVLRCPAKTRRVLNDWYRRPVPTAELAKEFGMSPRSLQKAHALALNFVRWRFEESRHITLLKLLRVRV